MRTINEMRGARVLRKVGKRGRLGKIGTTVFSPDGMTMVGYVVKRPDFLWMFKRPDKFLARDSVTIQDGAVAPAKGSKSFDAAAWQRLGLDYEKCLLMENMDVITERGRELGRVTNAAFDEVTGEVEYLSISDGSGSRALVGTVDIPRRMIRGYTQGNIVVDAEASAIRPSGGAAAAAGEATAKATAGMTRAGAKASKAWDEGSVKLGHVIGKGKKALEEATTPDDELPAPKAASGTQVAPKSASQAPKPAPEKESDAGPEAARAVGKHLKAAGSMFDRFKEEFDKESSSGR